MQGGKEREKGTLLSRRSLPGKAGIFWGTPFFRQSWVPVGAKKERGGKLGKKKKVTRLGVTKRIVGSLLKARVFCGRKLSSGKKVASSSLLLACKSAVVK